MDNEICDPLPKDVQLLEPIKKAKQKQLSRYCTGGMKDSSDLPANCIGHDEAKKYCDWKGLRLPTEIGVGVRGDQRRRQARLPLGFRQTG